LEYDAVSVISVPWKQAGIGGNKAIGARGRRARSAAKAAPEAPTDSASAEAQAAKKATEKAAERALIEACQRGEEAAYKELVERYQRRAFWLARKLEEDARDISQKAFIRVFKSIHRFDHRYRFYTWLYKIVQNLSVDHLRKRGDRRNVSIDAVGDVQGKTRPVDMEMRETELSGRVGEVLDMLPPKYKTVMVLRELEGFDAKEIAEMVGSTHATIRWRLHRARALFREEWVKLFGEETPSV
jgi:RNA polymerase sigma-70 factor (ECF subfamily)